MTSQPPESTQASSDGASAAEPVSNGNDGIATPAAEAGSERVQELETQLKDEKNRYLYLYAEFENFRKRSIKERSDAAKFGWEPVALDLLQVVDNLGRAIEHTPPNTDKTLVDGLNMIHNQFKSTLERQGLQQIRTDKSAFDPNFHEAVAQEPSDLPEGTIIKEFAPGFTLHGRLLRPARVVVSSGKS